MVVSMLLWRVILHNLDTIFLYRGVGYMPWNLSDKYRYELW